MVKVMFAVFLGMAFGVDLKEIEKKVEEMKKDIKIEHNIYEKEAKERAKKLYEYFKTEVSKEIEKMKKEIATRNYKVSEERIKRMLNAENPVLVFMSSSVPKEIWERYMDFVEKKNIPAVFLLRGCIGGCKYIRPTIEFLKSLIILGENKYRKVEVAIDPLLFRKYSVKEVPCVVWNGKKSCGDWSFEYHLRVLGYGKAD